MMKIILASASPRRHELFKKSNLPFDIESSDVPEISGEKFPYSGVALENAGRKAKDVALKNPDALVIGCDTVIEFRSGIIGKPVDFKDAFRILKSLSGESHYVATGVCVICLSRNIYVRFAERSKVQFRKLRDEDILSYLSHVNVLDKAGAYAVQEYGETIIEKTEGSRDNIIGLPTERLFELLALLYK